MRNRHQYEQDEDPGRGGHAEGGREWMREEGTRDRHAGSGGPGGRRSISAGVSEAWQLASAATPFTIELALGAEAWTLRLNGEVQPDHD
eukprot:8228259-Pyramimonas_sp.AAC.1